MKVLGALIPNFGQPFSTPVFYYPNFYNKESYIKIVESLRFKIKLDFTSIETSLDTTLDLEYFIVTVTHLATPTLKSWRFFLLCHQTNENLYFLSSWRSKKVICRKVVNVC